MITALKVKTENAVKFFPIQLLAHAEKREQTVSLNFTTHIVVITGDDAGNIWELLGKREGPDEPLYGAPTVTGIVTPVMAT